ncbi:hypothetical protein [Spirosoma aerophilum]
MDSSMFVALLLNRDLIVTGANPPQLAPGVKKGYVFGIPLAKAIGEIEVQPFLDIQNQMYTL